MKNIMILFCLFLFSCSSTVSKNNFDFSDEMTFDEFKLKLNEYAENNPYPNIDD
tara:strand:+ start:19 stop:180 length:162 start_codon:yes stop_codon:yes gene_type:complete